MSVVRFANFCEPSGVAASISSHFDGAATPTIHFAGAAPTPTIHFARAAPTPTIHFAGAAPTPTIHFAGAAATSTIDFENGDLESREVASTSVATINLPGAAPTIHFESPRVVSTWLRLHIHDGYEYDCYFRRRRR